MPLDRPSGIHIGVNLWSDSGGSQRLDPGTNQRKGPSTRACCALPRGGRGLIINFGVTPSAFDLLFFLPHPLTFIDIVLNLIVQLFVSNHPLFHFLSIQRFAGISPAIPPDQGPRGIGLAVFAKQP